MFNKGDIVYHDQVIFQDNVLDDKKRRLCVVLFSLERGDKKYVCTCPFTSQVHTFNKRPKNYKFMSEPIYNYHKLSFAKINSARLYLEKETHKTKYKLSSEIVDSISDKILSLNLNHKQKQLEIIQDLLKYEKLFLQLEKREEKKLLKQQRKEKRRRAKRI